MVTSARLTRQKISTTVAPPTVAYLEKLVCEGEARTLAEAIDLAIQKLLAYENRERLENDTEAYFANLTGEEAAEEERLEAAIAQSAARIDFGD